MFTRKTFFLLLTAVCLGNVASATGLSMDSTNNIQFQSAGAIAGVPLNPGEKGEPDSTMSGTTRSGFFTTVHTLS